MIRPATPEDTADLIAIGDASGIFRPHEAESLLGGVLEALHAGRLGEGHRADVWAEDSAEMPRGWVYYAPAATAEGVWDLWWIGVEHGRQARGIGGELLGHVESQARAAGGRLLVIETSDQPKLKPTRQFYARRGYAECGRIPHFYADGDAKVIFAKRLTASPETR